MTQGKRESATQLESKQITFGTLLHDFRIGKEISQFDLAVNIKRAPSDISRWEKGTRKPPSDRATVISIANALKLSVPDKN